MPYVIALDQGTTSSRAIVFDHQGNIVQVAQEEFQQIFPKPGYVEHDASEIWHTQLRVINQVVESVGLSAGDVAAIGITNQRETTVVWERSTGLPIHNAIVWQDRRTAVRCGQLQEAGHTQKIREKTGLILESYFSATKLQWILDNVEGARRKAAAGDLVFGTIDSWLIWNLTKGELHVTDASNASRTLLFNIHTGDWDDELLDLFKVPRGVLPNVVGSSEIYGHVADGLPLAGVPIAGIAGDQQAALFGQMCDRPGMVKNTYGTGCFMLMNTGKEAVTSKHNLLTTIAWKIDDEICYALEGSIFVAGALVQWLRDGLEFFGSASEIESLAASVPDNGGVYFVPALAGLGAPHWDPFARGAVFGLTRGTTKAHIARAALEGIAYQVADVLDAMQSDANLQLTNLRVDGGAAANSLMMQFQADLLHVPVVRPRTLETTALGAAYLAGLAVGFWNDREELGQQWQIDHTFQPEMADSQVEELKRNWRKALERSKGWAD